MSLALFGVCIWNWGPSEGTALRGCDAENGKGKEGVGSIILKGSSAKFFSWASKRRRRRIIFWTMRGEWVIVDLPQSVAFCSSHSLVKPLVSHLVSHSLGNETDVLFHVYNILFFWR